MRGAPAETMLPNDGSSVVLSRLSFRCYRNFYRIANYSDLEKIPLDDTT